VRPQTIYPALDVLPWAQLSLLTAVFATFLQEGRKRRWTLLDTGMTVYTCIVLISLITAFDPGYGLGRLDLYLSWVLVFYVLSTGVNTQTRVVLLLIGYFLWNFKMSQHGFRSWASVGFGFRNWGVTGAPGWFANSGEFGIQMCLFMPLALFFALGVRKHVSRWKFALLLFLPFTAVAGAIASSSRGALLGMAVVGLWIVARSRYRIRGAIALTAVGLAAYAFVPDQQRERISSSGDDGTSINRLRYWERGLEFANDHPFLGIGYANWMPYYTHTWGRRLGPRERVQLPHNFFVEALAELGYTGLLALFFLLIGTFVLNAKTRALARRLGGSGELSWHIAWGLDGALIGYIASGFFVTVLYYPYLWVNLGMTVAVHLSVARAVRAARGMAERGVVPRQIDPVGAVHATASARYAP
jgi:O-antigen ligase